jgi:hypothetical protein
VEEKLRVDAVCLISSYVSCIKKKKDPELSDRWKIT